MRRILKRALSVLLAVTMIFGTAAFGFSDVDWSDFAIKAKAETSGYYTYTVSDGKATITDVSGFIIGNITIPSTLGGYPVTSIGDDAFAHCNSLTSISIPDSVTSIGVSAFESCDNLKSITIPDSVTSIGVAAFRACYLLESVIIGNRVTSIGDSAFEGCISITSITIPDSVTIIDDWAFVGCSSLTSITIPNSVTYIGFAAFDSCTRLTSINVDSRNSAYSSDEYGVLFNKNKTELILYPIGNRRNKYVIPNSVITITNSAFYYCDHLISVIIPNSVTSIGGYAFCGCTSLTSVTIGNSVTSIGELAFDSCFSLTSVTIGNSVTSIGDFAFAACKSLTSITIPDSVTSIGYGAFAACKSLTSIIIGDSVTSIGSEAFYGCDSLTDVYYTGTEAEWNKISIGSNNDELLNANIHFAKKTFPNGYNFDEDSYSFGNYSDKISEKYFTTFFEEASAKELYEEENKRNKHGVCFGLAYTTAAFYSGFPTTDNAYDIGNSIVAENISNIHRNFDLQIGENTISVDDYIKYAYIYQDSAEFLTLSSSSLKGTLKDYIENDMVGVAVFIFRYQIDENGEYVLDENGDKIDEGGHAVLAVGMEEKDGKTIIYVDDSNSKDELQTITFDENGNWEFSNPWTDSVGSKVINNQNSVLEYAVDTHVPYRILLTGKKTIKSDEESNSETYIEGMERLSADKVLLNISADDYIITPNDYYKIRNDFSGDSTEKNENDLYWISDDEIVTVSGLTDEDNEIALAGDNTIIRATVTKDSVATMRIYEDDIYGIIDAKKGDEYTLSFETYNENGKEVTITLNGTSSGEEIKVVETEDGINITGAESGMVTLTVDEEVVSEYTFGNAQGDIGIEYDKTAESGDMEIVYENSLSSLGDIIGDFEIENKGTLNIAPEIAIENCTFSYSSSDSDVVTVDESGNVRAENIGTATITCTVTDEYGNTYSDTCSVSVLPRRFSLIWNVDGVETAETIEEGAAIAVPTLPEKEGYRFVGWTPEVPEVMPAEDLVFTAVFEEIEPDIPEEPSEPTTQPTTVPEETTTEPVVTEPATTTPVEVTTTQPATEPSTTQPTTVAPTEPATEPTTVPEETTTEPVVTEPTTTTPVEVTTTQPVTEPSTTQPTTVAPTEPTTEPTTVPEETTTEPVVTEPATTTPVEVTTTQPVTEPSTTQPTTVAPTEPATEPTTVPDETTTEPVVNEPDFVVEIRNPSKKEIEYGDSFILHADIDGELPAGAVIEWTADNTNFTIVEISEDGRTCTVTPNTSGDTVFTATVVDSDKNVIASDSQTMTSKAGFFRKLIAFFKKLFGLTEVIPEVFKGIL